MTGIDLDAILAEVAAAIGRGAARIEQEADRKEDVPPGPFGIAVACADGRIFAAGEATTAFPIQSIAKVFALDLALAAVGDAVFERVGREPSGDPFNSIIDLERNRGVPRNPFVNAGALAVVDVLVDHLPAERHATAVVEAVRAAAGVDRAALDEEVMASELHAGGDLNRAVLSFMRHHGNLRADPAAVMDAYVRQCALLLDVRGLALAGLALVDTRCGGGEEADAVARRRRKVLALMMTCGHYDASGDFALRVGVPAKSGVGGGILAVVPGVASLAAWSPNLDQHGNSILGVHALEMLCDRTGWSVFAPAAGA